MNKTQNQFYAIESSNKQWQSMYKLGGIATILALIGIFIDVIIGNITGGNLTSLPQTAIERFAQFHENKFFGLYSLDLLNIIIQMILIPAYIALYGVHRKINQPFGFLALVVFIFGTVIMVSNNTSMQMLELSNKYLITTVDSQKTLYAAAGEAMLAQGAHGSLAFFLGFFIPNIAGLIMSIVMLKGKIFSKINSWLGIIGNLLMLTYVITITFVPSFKSIATVIAMPGGLLLIAWMIIFTKKLFQLSHTE